ncbi:hypothetical protein H312_03636, partial [Anncaliia algerae PRA339]
FVLYAFIPSVIFFTIISILISFLIPAIAPLVSMVFHAYPLLVYNLMAILRLSIYQDEFAKKFYGPPLIFLGSIFAFLPSFLYVTLIRIPFIKCVIKSFDIQHVNPNNVFVDSFKNYILYISGTIDTKYTQTWRLVMAAMISVCILILMANAYYYGPKRFWKKHTDKYSDGKRSI